MSGEDTPKRPRPKAGTRDARLKRALKANLARRKAQAKGRASDKADGDQPGKGDGQEG